VIERSHRVIERSHRVIERSHRVIERSHRVIERSHRVIELVEITHPWSRQAQPPGADRFAHFAPFAG
jgi:hypothetical protein